MKKIFFILALILSVTNAFADNQNYEGFKNYRYNPFQFPYPEYYLKAEVIEIKSLETKLDETRTIIDFYGLSEIISKKWFDNMSGENKSGRALCYRIGKSCKLVIYENKEDLRGCIAQEVRNAERDFCSAFSSSQEYYDKVWLLTPDDLRKVEYASVGNSWLIHNKGILFTDVKLLYKYQGMNFVAYRRDYKDGTPGEKSNLKTELTVFHQKIAPNYISIGIGDTDDNYEELLNEILTTLE